MTARVTFPASLRRFESLELFYADDERRRRSPEADYGVFWWDGLQGHSATWRIAAVEATGEIYAVRSHGFSLPESGDRCVLLGRIADEDPGYLLADAALEGWNLVCGQSSSLGWAIERVLVAAGVYPAPLSVLCRLRHIGGHVHVDVFVGRVAGSRGKAGELILQTREWEVFRAGLEAGFGDRLELVDRDTVAHVPSAHVVRQERLA